MHESRSSTTPPEDLHLYPVCAKCNGALGDVDVVAFECGHWHHKACLKEYDWAYKCPREIFSAGDKKLFCPACKYKSHPNCPRSGIGRSCTDFIKGKCRRGFGCSFCHFRHPSRERDELKLRKRIDQESDAGRRRKNQEELGGGRRSQEEEPLEGNAVALWPADTQRGYEEIVQDINSADQSGYTNSPSKYLIGMHAADNWDCASSIGGRASSGDNDAFRSMPANWSTLHRLTQDTQNGQDTWGLQSIQYAQRMQGVQTKQDCYFPQTSMQPEVTSSRELEPDAASQSADENGPSFSDVSALDLLTERLEEIFDAPA